MRKGKGFSFIHCADLHLDSQFKGVSAWDDAWAAQMRGSTFTALDRMVSLAKERDVDFIVVAGDTFDSDQRSVRAQFRFRDAMETLGVPCYLACGNHDPLDGWSDAISLPGNVHRFSAQGETVPFERDGSVLVAISGISYPRRDVREDLSTHLHPEPGVFNIAVLHCNVGSSDHEAYSPTTIDVLQSRGFDYWALGHVHERRVVSTEPHIVYPGNTQGRHVNEPGRKGCHVVTVDQGMVIGLEFVELAAFEWRRVRVDISGHPTLDSLTDSVRIEGKGVIAELEFVGRGPLDNVLRAPDAAREVAKRICDESGSRLARFKLSTRPPLDLEAMSGGHDLMAEILRTADGMRDASSVIERLKGVEGASRFKDWLDGFSEQELLDMVEDAALLLADRLLEEGE